MARNNSFLFLFGKMTNDSLGRPHLRIDMSQVQNLKSLGFPYKNIADLRRVSASFWSLYFCNRPFCGRRHCKTSICISCYGSSWFTCTNPMKLSVFTSPIFTFCTGQQFFELLLSRWLLVFIHQPFFTKSINDFSISFGAFSLIMITRRMHWPPAVFTFLTNWLLGKFVLRVYLQFH